MLRALRAHWPEYLSEFALLGFFMISAGVCTILFEHPASPVVSALPDPFLRRLLIGVAMGLTLLGLIFSPQGKRSGAHLNPAVTLTYWLLGKIQPWDALFYVVAQFAGGIVGVALVASALPPLIAHPAVHYVITQPGASGPAVAFLAEFAISFVLMLTVLQVSNRASLARYTPFFAATLVAAYITVEAPFSGMSMNPARTFGSALSGHAWTGLWIYFTAPLLAMQLAGLLYRRSGRLVHCAKLHHYHEARCIFHCTFHRLLDSTPVHPPAIRASSPSTAKSMKPLAVAPPHC